MGLFFWDFTDYNDIERYNTAYLENGQCSLLTYSPAVLPPIRSIEQLASTEK